MGRRSVRVSVAIAVAALICAAGLGGWRLWGRRGESGGGVAATAPRSLAAVLVPDSERASSIVVVDLDSLKVVRRVRLRSTATEMALDATSGLLVTAQCGGLGSGSDDAAGIVNPRTGAVSYVRLERPNPEAVAMAGGRAFVMHGWTDEGREGTFHLSVVDPAAGTLDRSGVVPETASLWSAAGGRLWTTGRSGSGDGWTLMTVQPSDLATAIALSEGKPVNAVIDGADALYLLSARLPTREATSGWVTELDPATLRTRRRADLSGLRYGATRGAATRERIAAIDDIGDADSSRVVIIVDRADLAVVRAVKVAGLPAALTAWGDRFVLVDREGGKLLVLDPEGGRVTGSVDLGSADLPWVDVDVMPSDKGVSEL